MQSQTPQEDVNLDFMSPLTPTSNVDLTLPFENKFQDRQSSTQGDDSERDAFQSHEEMGPESDCPRPAANSQPVKEKQPSKLANATATPRYDHDSKQDSPSPSPQQDFSDADSLDDYHRGLLQVSGTNARDFRPSYRRQASFDEAQNKAAEQGAHSATSTSTSTASAALKQKRRPSKLALPSNRHIPAAAFQRESFWTDGDEHATPRVTLTRYDLRTDEREIYAYKDGGTSRRSDACLDPLK